MKIDLALPPSKRDLRLDLFRGLANWLMFLGHVSTNVLAWFSFRNYGFSDGANLFVFISGYTSALVFGRIMLKGGFVFGSTRRSLRVWQIYAAHKSELTSRQSMIWINIVQRQWRYFDLISA